MASGGCAVDQTPPSEALKRGNDTLRAQHGKLSAARCLLTPIKLDLAGKFADRASDVPIYVGRTPKIKRSRLSVSGTN